jgi:hypothetical protein
MLTCSDVSVRETTVGIMKSAQFTTGTRAVRASFMYRPKFCP